MWRAALSAGTRVGTCVGTCVGTREAGVCAKMATPLSTLWWVCLEGLPCCLPWTVESLGIRAPLSQVSLLLWPLVCGQAWSLLSGSARMWRPCTKWSRPWISRIRHPGLESQLYCLLAVGPRESRSTSLSFRL